MSYKLRMYPTRNKADTLALLTALFQRAHSDCTLRMGQPSEQGRPPSCPSSKGLGEFAGRAYRRAYIDYRRSLKAARKTGRKFTPPTLRAELIDSADIQLPKRAKGFDYWILLKGTKDKLYIPARGHRALNRALALPGAKLNLGTKGSAQVFRKNGKWYALVYVTVPLPEVQPPKGWLGCDVGVHHSVVRSDGYRGRTLKGVVFGPRRCRKRFQPVPRKRYARTFQRQVLNGEARRAVSVAQRSGRGISLEDPQRLPKWGGWGARIFANAVLLLSAIVGVPVRLCKPAYTSQTCPRCSSRDTFRVNEMFRCLDCRYTNHADFVGALNLSSGFCGVTAVSHGSSSLVLVPRGGGADE